MTRVKSQKPVKQVTSSKRICPLCHQWLDELIMADCPPEKMWICITYKDHVWEEDSDGNCQLSNYQDTWKNEEARKAIKYWVLK